MPAASCFRVRRPAERWLRAELVFVAASLLALFVLFFLTDAQRWAEQYTSINRVFLHFVPAFLFFVLTVFQSLPLTPDFSPSRREESERLPGGEHPLV